MRKFVLTLGALFVCVTVAAADNGFISLISTHDVKSTADRLEKALREKGMTVFVRIDHAGSAQNVGEKLRPTELLIFGNPKVGAPLMQCSQTIAIDLPQKALIWEDETGQVWLSYNDPTYLAKRHGIGECGDVIRKVGRALSNFAHTATRP